MHIKQTIKASLFTFVFVLLGATATVLSVGNTAQAAECAGVTTSIISCDQTGGSCEDGSDPTNGKCADGKSPVTSVENTGLWGILLLVINIFTAGIGIAAVAGVVYGSILYTSAGGSQEQVKKAMGVFTNVAIGVIAYAGMYALLNFIIPGGLFN